MPLSDLPKPIQEHILDKVNEEYQSATNTFSLTELLYCIRKSYFRRTSPKPLSLESSLFIYRGELLDEAWTPLFKRNQIRCTYRCKNIPAIISGRYDFLDGEDSDTIYDLKTVKTLHYITEPKKEHEIQIRFYAYMNAIPKARLLYMDFGDVRGFDVEVGDCTQLLEDLEGKVTLLFWALQRGKPPKEMGPAWMCPNCEYKKECEDKT